MRTPIGLHSRLLLERVNPTPQESAWLHRTIQLDVEGVMYTNDHVEESGLALVSMNHVVQQSIQMPLLWSSVVNASNRHSTQWLSDKHLEDLGSKVTTVILLQKS